MPRLVKLNDVWRMLDACAAGYTRRETDHHWIVAFRGLQFRSLPLGAHGRRVNAEIETGYVRAMVRMFGLDATCVQRHVNLA